MGRLYASYLIGYNRPPTISPTSPSTVQVHLNANIVVSFGVSDVDGNEFGVYAISTPTAGDLLTSPPNNSSSTYTYSFTVTSDLFLAPSIAPLMILAVDYLLGPPPTSRLFTPRKISFLLCHFELCCC